MGGKRSRNLMDYIHPDQWNAGKGKTITHYPFISQKG
jgi:hypothetical protein